MIKKHAYFDQSRQEKNGKGGKRKLTSNHTGWGGGPEH